MREERGPPERDDPGRHARTLRWRLLRRLLPAWFRARYGTSLLRLHVERAGGSERAGGPRFWSRLVWDVVATSVEVRLDPGPADEHLSRGTMKMTLGELASEARILTRSLMRRPGYVTAAVATLGLGIGVAASIFSLVHGSMLQALPYPAPEELVEIRDLYRETGGSGSMSAPNYLDLRERTRTLEDFAAYTFRSVNLATEGAPVRATGLAVTSNFLEVLGVRPHVGRDFTEAEEMAGAPPVAVVSHELWRERFGGSDEALGASVPMDGAPVTIVGVLPEDFWFPGDPDFLFPVGIDLEQWGRGSRALIGVGRLADGTDVEAGQRELQAIFAELDDPNGSNDGWTVRLRPFREYAVAGNRDAFYLLGGAALLVLLIGCVNVANLMLVRAERRQKEMAVRSALGAGGARIARQYLGESLLLALGAAVVGTGFAWGGSRLLVAVWGDSLPRQAEIGVTPTILLFVLSAAALTAVLIGLVPVLRFGSSRLFSLLREGGYSGAGSSRGLQRALITGEVALAVLIVAGAGLMLNSAWRASRIDGGVALDHALAFRVQVPSATYQEYADVTRYFTEAIDRIERIPAVRSAGITDRTPLRGGYNITTLASPDDPELTSRFVEIRRVTPGFFDAAGIPLLRGRLLEDRDGETQAEVVVISERVVREIFPDGDALGKRVFPGWNEEGYEVVGVVGNVREFGLLGEERPALYWPYPVTGAQRSMTVVVRTDGTPPMEVMPTIRRQMLDLDPTIPLYGVETLRDVALGTLGARRLATSLFASFGAIALLLAGLGVFSVLAYSVEKRTREIGIRIAVGAGEGRVVRHVVGQGLQLVLLGLILGGVGAWYGGRFLNELLYEVQPDDLLTLGSVMAVVFVSSLVAAWLPARRAARVEPSIALRTE